MTPERLSPNQHGERETANLFHKAPPKVWITLVSHPVLNMYFQEVQWREKEGVEKRIERVDESNQTGKRLSIKK